MRSEKALRKQAATLGLNVVKTPARHWMRKFYGVGYEVYRHNTSIAGNYNRRFELDLQDLGEFIESYTG